MERVSRSEAHKRQNTPKFFCAAGSVLENKLAFRAASHSDILSLMFKQSLISGIVLFVLPIVGIPEEWKTWIYVVIGLALIVRFFFEKKIFWNVFVKKPVDNNQKSDQNAQV